MNSERSRLNTSEERVGGQYSNNRRIFFWQLEKGVGV